MKTNVVIVIALIMNSAAFPETKELFPLDELKINMSVGQLKEAYPEAKWSIEKKDDKGVVLEAMGLQSIADNAFWGGALIFIRSDRVNCFVYGNIENFDLTKENVPGIYQQLVEHFGKEPERKVAASEFSEGEEMPVYLWKMNDQIVTFNHTPFEGHKKGEEFSCTLRVMEQDLLPTAFINISDYSEDKAVLFEIPGKPEAVKSFPITLVISAIVFVGLALLFVAYKKSGKT